MFGADTDLDALQSDLRSSLALENLPQQMRVTLYSDQFDPRARRTMLLLKQLESHGEVLVRKRLLGQGISEGHELVPLPEGNQYLGYIFANAETAEQVTAAIREAYACLKFVTAPVFKIN